LLDLLNFEHALLALRQCAKGINRICWNDDESAPAQQFA